VTSEPYSIVKEGGFEPNIFLLADYGFETYSTLIDAMANTVKDRPETVKCFVEGSILGWTNYMYGDRSAANKLIQTHNPDMSDDQINFSIAQLKKFGIVDSGESETLGIGAMNADRIKRFYDDMVKAGVVDAGIDVTKVYDLSYINKGLGVDIKKKLMAQ
jgi:NitT/TauT family transport system substrate-binding protein